MPGDRAASKDAATRPSIPSAGRDRRARWLFVAIAAAGTLLYAAFAFGLFLSPGTALVGDKIYDYYFLALIDGRFDIPPRIATLEGHYDAGGRAYVYHGAAPLVTRLVLWPFVDLKEASFVPSLTVWLFAALGSMALHLVAARMVDAFGPDGARGRGWHLIAGLAAWLCAPGLLLAANHAVFHEPAAVAYFSMMGSLYFYAQLAFFGMRPARVVLPLAILAGFAVLARPHVAIGLYLGVGLVMLAHLRRDAFARAAPHIAALLVLGLCGATLLGLNAARFGDPLVMHGGGEGAAIEYGYAFWNQQSDTGHGGGFGAEPSFAATGAFDPARIPANLFIYAVDLPWGKLVGRPLDINSGPIDALYRAWTLERLGVIWVEAPRIGMAFLWAPWLLIAACGALNLRASRDRALSSPASSWVGWIAPLVFGVVALFILSYGSVTLRYKFETFPMVASLAILGLPRVLALQRGDNAFGIWVRRLAVMSVAGSAFASLVVALLYADNFNQLEGISHWTYETCERLALENGFSGEAVPRLCRL